MGRRVRWPLLLLLALSSWCLTWAVEGSAVQPLASEEQRQADTVNQSRKDPDGRLGAPTEKGRRLRDLRRADGNQLRVDPHQRIPEEEVVLARRRRLLEMEIHRAESAGERQKLMRDRDYLNGLVAESAAKTREQACNVAFVKTHKTASTTLAMILVRYARRHDKKLASFGGDHVSAIPLEEAAEQIERSGERVDVMHYHYTAFGLYTRSWQQVTAMYEKIMREDERINYISVVRDARSHFLSFYYFYVQPEVHLSVQHFYGNAGRWMKNQHARLENPMCLEFGIRSEKDLDAFIEQELPKFRLVILTDKFDEGLMVLRRLMGWDMIDMTYSRMMATKGGTQRWDGKELKSPPRFEDLPRWVQEAIDNNTALDRKLYAAAEELYEKRKEVWAVEISADVVEFQELQGMLSRYLERNSSSEANLWYSGSVQPYLGGPPFHPFR